MLNLALLHAGSLLDVCVLLVFVLLVPGFWILSVAAFQHSQYTYSHTKQQVLHCGSVQSQRCMAL